MSEWQTMRRAIERQRSEHDIARMMKLNDMTREQAIEALRADEFWWNDTFGATIKRFQSRSPFVPTTQLNLWRNDDGTVRDWYDLQRIKNDVLGVDVEAFELYPAESRLVDTANSYHLWAFPAGYRIPLPIALGRGRMVTHKR
jgi:hypothetical protein